MDDITMTKNVLRDKIKGVLNLITPSDRQVRSNKLINDLINKQQYIRSKRVAVYLSMKDEVDLDSLLRHIFTSDKQCFIPRYHKHEMRMLRLHSLADYDSLPLTKWNIKQPSLAENDREDALLTGGLDMVVVPGLAFTESGKRLGRGMGYYDRFMNETVRVSNAQGIPVPYFVALAFKEQQIDDIPTTDNDFSIDEVLFC